MPARIVQSLDFEGRFRCAKRSWRGMNFQEQSEVSITSDQFHILGCWCPPILRWDPWSPKNLMIRVVTSQHPWVGWLASLASESIFYPSLIGTSPYDFITKIALDFTSNWWNPMFCPDCSWSSSPKNTLVRTSKRKMLLQNANHCCLRERPFWSNSWSSNISNGPLEIRKKTDEFSANAKDGVKWWHHMKFKADGEDRACAPTVCTLPAFLGTTRSCSKIQAPSRKTALKSQNNQNMDMLFLQKTTGSTNLKKWTHFSPWKSPKRRIHLSQPSK